MKETQPIYDSPRVEVVDVKAMKMLCGSDPQENESQPYERDDW